MARVKFCPVCMMEEFCECPLSEEEIRKDEEEEAARARNEAMPLFEEE